ncbi:ABC transporter substrate-binding protein [Mannheimia haemolytica]|uniref:ABC transporter substrate-binding protein n=1 Tax=Mannheimia haemolytica TaxID=75985 RepID=UPI00038602F0|nr:ABC transporter substrate-binding protein [Mannheimia haemolytica]EPZ01585.1 peptide ABC transporter substrate-binding protein [Mannheimia haemolytica D35]MDW1149198.1 ABC transporter substrate-binding protein [Mannheimia haemolytica]MDW1159414.1 ABC transporter substrate-binding protein [Mannheimia haemolytica]TRC47373.1 ABC transporter substrate-binding protein [Mannheimia haemolytica]TRC47941.1 ABC transporter substrate-binding protein [Mannheimia haemolytica]
MNKLAVIFSVCFANLGLNSTAYAAPSIPQELLENSLVYCTTSSGFSFNPQKSDVSSNMNVVTEQIYDKLVEFNPKKNRLEPALAESYSISDDGLVITLRLRKNVAFHTTPWFTPSRKLNAEDVVFSLKRMIGKESDLPEVKSEPESVLHHQRQSYIYQKTAGQIYFPYFESVDLANKIASIHSPSNDIVKIELVRPDSALLAHLASQYAVILSKEYALQLNADDNLVQLDLLPVGTGVYQLESYENNDYVRLKPNMNYWGKKAYIQNMVVDFSTEATGRMAKFLNNECDVVAFPEPSQLSVLNNRQLISSKGANLVYLAFNMQRGIGQDLALRQRIARGINRKRIAEKLFYGTGEVADNLLPTALWSKKNNGSYPYQPHQNSGEQAVEMHDSIINRSLDSKTETEEVNQKQRLKLWVIDEKRVYNQHPLKMAEMIRADLATQNLEVEIRAVSRAYLVQQLANKSADHDLILGGWLANNLDPNSFLEALLSCKAAETVTNLSNWCNEDFDFWLQTARLSDDPASANLLYEFAQKLLEEQLPILPLMNANRVLVIKDGVKQADISPFGQVKLSELRLGLGHKKGN